MTTGYVLILAVLILGGVIATLGDRIGMRVGKARLSLFRLRPRQTATVVSILTGSLISASTLGLLFAVSRQLRTGVFELEQIQSDLDQAKAELEETRTAKTDIEGALQSAREQRLAAQEELQSINQSLRQAVEKQQRTQAELRQTQNQLGNLRAQLGQVSEQAAQLQSEIQRLETERAALLEQQATVQAQLAERDQEIAERDQEIARREQRLARLQAQQSLLQEDIAALERQYEGLFRGNVVVGRNEPLVSGLIRVNNREEARQAVNRILREANRDAIQEIAPGTSLDRQVLLIPQEDVVRLINRIDDNQSYVVRVLSAANYIIGEPCVVAEADPCVQVFIDAVVNEIIYEQDEQLAVVTADTPNLTNQGLVEKLNLLISSLQFRARQDGIVAETLQIADGRNEALLSFLYEVRENDAPVEIRAIAAEPIYTIGPLRVELVAVSRGRVIARTDDLPRRPPAEDVEDEASTDSDNDDTPPRE